MIKDKSTQITHWFGLSIQVSNLHLRVPCARPKTLWLYRWVTTSQCPDWRGRITTHVQKSWSHVMVSDGLSSCQPTAAQAKFIYSPRQRQACGTSPMLLAWFVDVSRCGKCCRVPLYDYSRWICWGLMTKPRIAVALSPTVLARSPQLLSNSPHPRAGSSTIPLMLPASCEYKVLCWSQFSDFCRMVHRSVYGLDGSTLRPSISFTPCCEPPASQRKPAGWALWWTPGNSRCENQGERRVFGMTRSLCLWLSCQGDNYEDKHQLTSIDILL